MNNADLHLWRVLWLLIAICAAVAVYYATRPPPGGLGEAAA